MFNEAGFGDMIQNIRYLPQLKALGPKVILDVKEELYKLLLNTKGVDQVIKFTKEERANVFGSTFTNLGLKLDLPPHDYVVSLHSLVYYFDPNLEKIPLEFPYIFPQPSTSEAVKVVKEHKAKIKAGITFCGNPNNDSDDHRSTYKRNFVPLMKIPGVQLFSLQKGKMERDWNGKINLLEGGEVLDSIDLAPMIKDFNDTAAVLQELDALVCVDTSVGHLAGALDLPVWSALPDGQKWGDFRWQKKWYNSQKLFFQTVPEDWILLLEKITQDLLDNPIISAKITT